MMRISFAKHERPTRRVLTPVSEHVRDCKWCIVRAFFSFCKLSLTKVQLFAFKTVWLYDFHSNFSNIRWMKFIDIAIQMPGGYSWEFLVGVCGPILQILTLFQIKKLSFSTSVFRHGVVTKRNNIKEKLCHHCWD